MRVSDAVIFATSRVAGAIDACQFELSFDHAATFRTSPRNAIVLSRNGGRELLWQLHVQIGIELCKYGCQNKSELSAARDAALRQRSDAAREFVPLRNRPGEHGYEYVGRWPLRARG